MCHPADPKKASTTPLSTTQNSARSPQTLCAYTQDPTYAGCRVGSGSVSGSVVATLLRISGSFHFCLFLLSDGSDAAKLASDGGTWQSAERRQRDVSSDPFGI
jgi:hypothetical protein